MMRKFSTIGLALVSVLLLTAGGHDWTILHDNFNDGDADGWNQNDFTVGIPGGPGEFNVVNGEYVIESTGPIAVDDPSVGTIESHWAASEDDPRFSNGKMSGTIRANTDGTSVGFTLRDSDETESGYDFCASTSLGTFYIDRFVGSDSPPQTILAIADPKDHPFVAGRTYHIEASLVGDKLEMRAWEVGQRKPNRPMLSVTDSVLGPDSASEISVFVFFDPDPLTAAGVTSVKVSGAFDNIKFKTNDGDDDDDD
jgi:hypothetical protein